MKTDDFIIYTLAGEAGGRQYVGIITMVDTANLLFSFVDLESGLRVDAQYSTTQSGPWSAQDERGLEAVLETHDIYASEFTDPVPQELAAIGFADGSRQLGFVTGIEATIDVQLVGSGSQLRIQGDTVWESDSLAYPPGTMITSIARCVLTNDLLGAPIDPPFVHEQPNAPEAMVFPEFDAEGWWLHANRRDAHQLRMGGAIRPYATVVHGTASPPEGFGGLIDSWTLQQGGGECAHFVIGRSPAEGVVQLVPIYRNANHAGGPGGGSFVAPGQAPAHPNLVSVGIEMHCGGPMRRIGGVWRVWGYLGPGQWGPVGNPIPDADAVPTGVPDQAVHRVTDYQYDQLGLLLDALERVLDPLPVGCVAQSQHQPQNWAIFATGRVVAHASLHWEQREDPWEPTCGWIRGWLVAHAWPFAA